MTTRQLGLEEERLYPLLPAARIKSPKKHELFYQATKTSTQQRNWLDDKVLTVRKHMEAEDIMTEREKLQKGSLGKELKQLVYQTLTFPNSLNYKKWEL